MSEPHDVRACRIVRDDVLSDGYRTVRQLTCQHGKSAFDHLTDGWTPEANAPTGNPCERCAQPIPKWRNRYCSDRCRSAANAAVRRKDGPKPPTSRPCATCGEPVPTGANGLRKTHPGECHRKYAAQQSLDAYYKTQRAKRLKKRA